MTSNQVPAPGGKAAKFAAANPLGPMADPFSGLNDDQKEVQRVLSENVQKRLEKGMDELKEKHRKGTNELDDPDRAPTGESYRVLEAQSSKRERDRQTQKERARAEEAERLRSLKEEARRMLPKESPEEDDDSDDDFLDDYDDDPELENIRQRRMQEMRAAQAKHAENLAKGHGQYRTISQDEFLQECTGTSEYVAIHFFHKEFERCQIMDHHLKIIAPLHTTCKFLRIDAEKAPFFVAKLLIKTLPALLVFRDGKAIDRLTGFEGLSRDPSDPDKWHTGLLQRWLAETGAIDYEVPTEEVREEMRQMGIQSKGAVWRGGLEHYDD